LQETNLLFFLAFLDYRKSKTAKDWKSLTDKPCSDYQLMWTRGGLFPIFRWERVG